MSQFSGAPLLILVVVIGFAGIAASVWRIARGGGQSLFGIGSLILMGGMVVLVIVIGLAFQRVSTAINSPPDVPQFQYTPIPWSTVSGFSTPSAPGLTIAP